MTGAMPGSRMHDDGRGDGSLGTQGSAMGRSRADSKAARRGAAAEHRQGDGAQQGRATGRSRAARRGAAAERGQGQQQQQGTAKLKQQQGTRSITQGDTQGLDAAAGRRYAGLGRDGWTRQQGLDAAAWTRQQQQGTRSVTQGDTQGLDAAAGWRYVRTTAQTRLRPDA